MQHPTNNTLSKTAALTTDVMIATDLDGTLLDHHTYSWAAAKPALELAQQKNIPVIPCTSKTLEETQKLINSIGLKGPIIFENGSGIALADGHIIDLAPKYHFIIEKLDRLKRHYGFKFLGFNSMSIEDIIEQTQLNKEDAENAKNRRYSEPFLWLDDTKKFSDFEKSCGKLNIDIVRGGRFYHALSTGITKQRAITYLKDHLNIPQAHTIALGDSNNDIPMLNAADTAVIINNPTRNFPVLTQQQNIHYTSAYGPTGWNTAIISLLNKNGE